MIYRILPGEDYKSWMFPPICFLFTWDLFSNLKDVVEDLLLPPAPC